ncbi:MAG: DCC1-like thiol-disulfide oxidoreductase family protein [Terracidiphilus sp.]|nr:DCC1-like thiol-disulfide oxidoreductase family protein [Terracidiphilus sp.]
MMMTDWLELGGRVLVVFDGRCGFCNASVRWLARRDGRDRLRFVAAEDERVRGLLERHGLGAVRFAAEPSTLVVVCGGGGGEERVLVRSAAVAAAMGELPVAWPAVAAMLRAVPRPVRDLGYRAVARARYWLGGRLEACPLPTAAERAKFL